MRPSLPTSTELRLIKENDWLRTDNVCLRRELTNKQDHIGRLEVLLRERMERIDQLVAQVDQLRLKNKQLDEEAEHLAAIIAAPQLDAA